MVRRNKSSHLISLQECLFLSTKAVYLSINCHWIASSLFGRTSNLCQSQAKLGRAFFLLQPQAAALPGSDAGIDAVESLSGLVIQNREALCSIWCPCAPYGPHSQFGERGHPICAWINGIA